jgi:hypothetical protein
MIIDHMAKSSSGLCSRLGLPTTVGFKSLHAPRNRGVVVPAKRRPVLAGKGPAAGEPGVGG